MSIDNRRIDLSNYLIHFTKGVGEYDDEGAYKNLKNILIQQRVFSSNKDIRGGYNCVCFTEAPIDCLKQSNGIVCYDGHIKYSNYGIMVPKIEIYKLGGRPAIYSDPEHFSLLHEELKFRFVRFEPLRQQKDSHSTIDFTWEREWRMKYSLDLSCVKYEIIVPTHSTGKKIIAEAEFESFKLFKNCSNQDVPLISYDELCNDVCLTHSIDCPEQVFINHDCIICMDSSC